MSHWRSDRHRPKPDLSIFIADLNPQLLLVDPPRECIVLLQDSFQFTFCDFQSENLGSDSLRLLVFGKDDSLEHIPPLDVDLVVRFLCSCKGMSIFSDMVVLHDLLDIDPSSLVAWDT